MNYEDLYQELQPLEKNLKEKLQGTQRSFKSITKNVENGDLRGLTKELTLLPAILRECEELTGRLQGLVEGFDAREYVENGDFARQMIEYCEQYAVDVTGEFPTYEIFPYKVKIDAENQDLYINRKKLHCVRPLSFVKDIKQSREKYIKAPFNVNTFLNELAAAYDLAAVMKGRKNNNTVAAYDLLLKDLYDYLAPTGRARREYDLQNYAFDLARLYSSEVKETKDHRGFEFGPSKNAAKQIRILDQNGKEQFLGTIRFFDMAY